MIRTQTIAHRTYNMYSYMFNDWTATKNRGVEGGGVEGGRHLFSRMPHVHDVGSRCKDGHVLQHLSPREPDLRAPQQTEPERRVEGENKGCARVLFLHTYTHQLLYTARRDFSDILF